MGLVGGHLGYLILKGVYGKSKNKSDKTFSADEKNPEKILKILFGENFPNEVNNKTIIDFGCGPGHETIQIARWGAKKAIGIDIQERFIESAKAKAKMQGVKCEFAQSYGSQVDIIISKDCFEHYSNPETILAIMYDFLRPGGYVLISFGPPWYHPAGGHFFSVFPWAHIIFKEKALIKWRADFKKDGAKKFSDVEGGLNKMTIKRFVNLIQNSQFSIDLLETVSIKKLRFLHNRFSREFTTSIVKCKLIK